MLTGGTLPEKVYADLGRISTAWAQIEVSVDLMNTVIFSWHKANAYEKWIPCALEAKVKFLRRAANRISTLTQYRAGLASLANDLLAEREDRNFFAHSAPQEIRPEGIAFFNLKNVNDNMLFAVQLATPAQIAEFAANSRILADRAWLVCRGFISDWIKETQ